MKNILPSIAILLFYFTYFPLAAQTCSAIEDLTICDGECIDIGCDDPEILNLCLSWSSTNSDNGSLSDISSPEINVCPSTNTTYYLKGVDDQGNTSLILTYNISVSQLNLKIESSTPFVCDDPQEPIYLNATTGYDSYLWSTGSTEREIKIFSQGTYSVTATIGNCQETTSISINEIDNISNIREYFESLGFFSHQVTVLDPDGLSPNGNSNNNQKSLDNLSLLFEGGGNDPVIVSDLTDFYSILNVTDNETPFIFATEQTNFCEDFSLEQSDEFYNSNYSLWIHILDVPESDIDFVFLKAKSPKNAPGVFSPVNQDHIDAINDIIEIYSVSDENLLNVSKNEIIANSIIQGLWSGYDVSFYDLASENDICSNLTMPFIKYEQESSPPISMNAFINLVIQEENKYSEADQRNTRLMITRLRRIFYNTDQWNNNMIPGTSGDSQESPYGTPRDRNETTVPVQAYPHPLFTFTGQPIRPTYNYTEKETHPYDNANSQIPLIYTNRDAYVVEGVHENAILDMAHLFAGLDIYNNPAIVCPPLVPNTDCVSNLDLGLSLGDIGSSVVYAHIESRQSSNHTSAEYIDIVQRAIDRGSPAEDLLGNIDPIVIGVLYEIDANSDGHKISEILSHYYLNTNPQNRFSGESLQDSRFKVYSSFLGLDYDFNSSSFSNKEDYMNTARFAQRTASSFVHAAGIVRTNPHALKNTFFDIKASILNKKLLRLYVETLENLYDD